MGAPQRRLLRERKAKALPAGAADPTPVPITRVTLVDGEPLDGEEEAKRWLESATGDAEPLVAAALGVLNLALRAQARDDLTARQLSRREPSAARLGYGDGDELANGVHREARELPDRPPRARRLDPVADQAKVAAALSGREPDETHTKTVSACREAFRGS